MSFTSLFLIALSVLPSSVLAAPIPHHHLLSRSTGKSLEPRADTGSSGWPKSSDFSKEKADFGVSGNFQEEYLTTLDGEPVLVGNYPKGSYAGAKTPPSGPGIAGFIFEAAGTDELGETVRLSYDVKFDEDFDFVRGGKLPGLYGGSDPATAKTCAGGHHDDSCWSARIMWREDGKGELYAYLSSANEGLAVCKGKCDVKYGASIDTGAWTFKAGEWTTITEEVTVGTKTGSIKVSVNGDQKIMVDNLTLAGKTRGAMIHTFFGGRKFHFDLPIVKGPESSLPKLLYQDCFLKRRNVHFTRLRTATTRFLHERALESRDIVEKQTTMIIFLLDPVLE